MRSFDSYISRRKIKDVPAWLASSGIKDLNSLSKLCEAEGIEFNADRMSKYFLKEAPPVVASKNPVIAPKKVSSRSRAKTAKSDPTANEEDKSTWHVPAAERPLGKTKRTRKTTAKSRTTKKSTTKKE